MAAGVMPYPCAVNILRPLKVTAKGRTFLINLISDLTGKVFKQGLIFSSSLA